MNRLMLVVVISSLLFSLACGSSREPVKEPPANAPGWHEDHDPKHGGLLFMAGNMFHHIEGTHPKPGLFQLYLYDDYTKPIDPQGTTGSVRLKGAPDADRRELLYDASSKTLIAQFDPPPPLPFELELRIHLADPKTGQAPESIFNFPFKAVGGEAPAAQAHAAGAHAHAAPHGGQVVTVGADHHFELVEANGVLTLWILDAQERTLPIEGMEAMLLVQPKAGAAVTIVLPRMGGHFMANSPLPSGEGGSAIATVTMSGTKRVARFKLGS